MAVRTGEVRRNQLIDRLLVPRPITHFLLVLLGVLLAQACWIFLPLKLLSYLSGTMAPFCLLCAGAVWGMRDKLDAAMDGEHMDAQTYARAIAVAGQQRTRFMRCAVRVSLWSLVAASAAISQQLVGTVWHWMVILCGVAVADSAFSYLLANSWDEQLRAFRSKKVLASKRRSEQLELADRIDRSRQQEGPTSPGAWTHSEGGIWTSH